MKKEIDLAVETFHKIAFGTGKHGRQSITDKQLASFVTVLTELLMARCKNTWYPQNPVRGSGYRCLRMNGQCMDPIIKECLIKSDIKLNVAQRAMELTVWVDPGIVSIRIGEEGSIGTEEVEMEPRRDSTSEDEAYVSRSPSPMSASSPVSHHLNVTPSKIHTSPSSAARTPKSAPGTIYPSASPLSMPSSNSGFSKGRSLIHHPMSNSQEYMPSGHIPTPSYSRPRTLFPHQDMNANGSNFAASYKEGLMASHHAAMAMRMQRSMHYMDIPAQA